MKMSTTLKTVFLTLGAAGLMSAAQAAPGKMGQHGAHDQGDHFARMAQELNLSAEQQKQLKPLHEKRMADMKAQREARQKERQQAREEERQAWAATPPDAAKLEALRQARVRAFDAQSKAMLEHRLAVAKVLTPEQRQKMQAMHAKRGEGKMRHKGQGKGQRKGQRSDD